MPPFPLVGRCTKHAIPTDTVAFSLVVKKGSRSRWPRLCPFAASSRFGIGVHFKISAGKTKEVCLPCTHVWYGTREQEGKAVGFLASQSLCLWHLAIMQEEYQSFNHESYPTNLYPCMHKQTRARNPKTRKFLGWDWVRKATYGEGIAFSCCGSDAVQIFNFMGLLSLAESAFVNDGL